MLRGTCLQRLFGKALAQPRGLACRRRSQQPAMVGVAAAGCGWPTPWVTRVRCNVTRARIIRTRSPLHSYLARASPRKKPRGLRSMKPVVQKHVAKKNFLVFDVWRSSTAAVVELGYRHAPPVNHNTGWLHRQVSTAMTWRARMGDSSAG